MVVDEPDQAERDARVAELHAVTDPQCNDAAHRAVVDIGAVGAVILEQGIAVAEVTIRGAGAPTARGRRG